MTLLPSQTGKSAPSSFVAPHTSTRVPSRRERTRAITRDMSATRPSCVTFVTARRTACKASSSRASRTVAAVPRIATRARAEARSVDERAAEAYERLKNLYASDGGRDDRIRGEQRVRDAMEDLGLAEAFEDARSRSKNRRDLSRGRSYGVTRTSFGAEVEIEASAAVVYGYWTTPAALTEILPELEKCEALADGARVRCEWVYAFRDASKRFGRQGIDALERHLSVVKATETAAGSSVRYEATAGMPVGADIAVSSTGGNSCTLDIEVWVNFPLALTNENGTMAVAMDAQEKLFDALMSFKSRVEESGAAANLEDIKARAVETCALGDRSSFAFTE